MKFFLVLMMTVSATAWAKNIECTFDNDTVLKAKILNNGKKLELLEITTALGRGEYSAAEDVEVYGKKIVDQKVSTGGLARFDFDDVGNDTNWLHSYFLYMNKNFSAQKSFSAKLRYYYSDEYSQTDSWFAAGECTVK